MEIALSLLTPDALAMARILALLALVLALVRAPWRALAAVPARQHVFFGGVLALVVLWSIAFHPTAGIRLHYLGMATVTLVFGWALASLAGLLALGVLAFIGQVDTQVLPLTWLLTAVVPAAMITGIVALLARSRIRNLFVFLLGVGFAGAMMTSLALVAAGLAALAFAGQTALVGAAFEHVALLPLLLFSEGFINGAAVSTITVYFPHMVRGFDEDRFLGE